MLFMRIELFLVDRLLRIVYRISSFLERDRWVVTSALARRGASFTQELPGSEPTQEVEELPS